MSFPSIPLPPPPPFPKLFALLRNKSAVTSCKTTQNFHPTASHLTCRSVCSQDRDAFDILELCSQGCDLPWREENSRHCLVLNEWEATKSCRGVSVIRWMCEYVELHSLFTGLGSRTVQKTSFQGHTVRVDALGSVRVVHRCCVGWGRKSQPLNGSRKTDLIYWLVEGKMIKKSWLQLGSAWVSTWGWQSISAVSLGSWSCLFSPGPCVCLLPSPWLFLKTAAGKMVLLGNMG